MRTSWLRTGALLGLAAALAGAAVSCDRAPLDPTQSITAVVSQNQMGIDEVSVELFEEGGTSPLDSGTTDDRGEVTFMDMAPGTYVVEHEVPVGYVVPEEATNSEAVMVAEEEAASVTFALGLDPNVVEVHLTSDFRFDPADLTITPGSTVRWINDAAIFHTITPDGHSEWERREMTAVGELYHHRFETLGEFLYFCEPHLSQGMTGTITVEEEQ